MQVMDSLLLIISRILGSRPLRVKQALLDTLLMILRILVNSSHLEISRILVDSHGLEANRILVGNRTFLQAHNPLIINQVLVDNHLLAISKTLVSLVLLRISQPLETNNNLVMDSGLEIRVNLSFQLPQL